MSFNGTLFLFGFLPITLALYYLLALTRLHALRLPLLIVATIGFYARSSAHYLPLLLGSVLINYLIGVAIARSEKPIARLWLWLGVIANLTILFWFKYAPALSQGVSDAFGIDIRLAQMALPLAISFYTFQQIGHLVDLWRGRIAPPHALHYFAFILFFPQLLSGPISLSREMVPQLAERPVARRVPADLLFGLAIFAFGLFKKTVIADSFALWTGPIFDAAAAGAHPSAASAWGGALAYTLQIYFDFAGYSDMAIGVARMFGLLLPMNFFSPFRARSVVDLWRRWHITLGRFVQTYLFQPLAVPLARFAVDRDLGQRAALIVATLAPTLLSMLIIGVWHGASWTFVLFGAMHGTYMMTNEAWADFKRRHKMRKDADHPAWRRIVATLATTLAFVLASVPFRSPDLGTAGRMFGGMIGLNGGPGVWEAWPVLVPLGAWGLYPLLIAGFLFVYLLPNTQQIMDKAVPALEWAKWRKMDTPPIAFAWQPTASWCLAIGAILMVGIAFIARGTTNFVYFGF
ncbi:MBOAT family O-acyltransferase [Sphingomonas bacterium]|uniref:MBOAT family O-acyltransferase n=1 Tax=Sphingomonas bacterium TaxID=1895847 RepID=UPI0015776705|nr:MBOAT family protein [Sphingomonas bacterium]